MPSGGERLQHHVRASAAGFVGSVHPEQGLAVSAFPVKEQSAIINFINLNQTRTVPDNVMIKPTMTAIKVAANICISCLFVNQCSDVAAALFFVLAFVAFCVV